MEQSSFFNSINNDREYDMEEFALYFKQFLSTGLYHTDKVPALRVTALTGLQSKMEPGGAYLEGYMYANSKDIVFTHEVANATNPRIDRIVIRLDRSVAKRSINAFIKKGTPATTPIPPVLQRNDIVYEISLAQVRINAASSTIDNVIDERLDKSVAGLVSSLITVPTEQFLDDWNKWFANTTRFESDWNKWFSKTIKFEEDWRNWFTDIQSGNPAMGGMKITVGSITPTKPTTNDIWIDTR